MSLAMILALVGCVTSAPGALVPEMRVEPERIGFGVVEVGSEASGYVQVFNDGSGTLHLGGAEVDGGDGAFAVASLDRDDVGPGSCAVLDVAFAPPAAGAYAGELVILGSDPERPEATVALLGDGLAPTLALDPAKLDFGDVPAGCAPVLGFTLANVGVGFAHVASVEVSPGGEITLEGMPEAGLDLGPGEVAAFDLVYAPTDEGRDSAEVTFTGDAEASLHATGSGHFAGTNLDVFEQQGDRPADVLIAVDTEMGFDRADVLAQLADLAAAALAAGDDFHLALVVADDGCVRGPLPWIDASFDPASAEAALDAMLDPDAAGLNGERAFMLLEAALAESGSGGCDEGFLRGASRLMLVGIGDEPDQSVNPWSTYVALFQSYRDDPDDVVVNAVGGDYPSGCGSAAAYVGLYEATAATGGLFLSICDPAWGAALAPLAATTDGRRDRFPLTADPVPDTIVVRVDDVLAPGGWAWDPAENAVVFEPDAIPEPGARVAVEYAVMGACEG